MGLVTVRQAQSRAVAGGTSGAEGDAAPLCVVGLSGGLQLVDVQLLYSVLCNGCRVLQILLVAGNVCVHVQFLCSAWADENLGAQCESFAERNVEIQSGAGCEFGEVVTLDCDFFACHQGLDPVSWFCTI